MKFKINSVVKLENNKRYVILKMVEYLEKEYYFAMEMNIKGQLVKDNTTFLFVDNDGDDTYIIPVDDESIIKELVRLV
jgi:hypothetical protein